jgi:hypothetical protein
MERRNSPRAMGGLRRMWTPLQRLEVGSSRTRAGREGGGFVYTSFNAANVCNYVPNGSPYFCDITTGTSLDFWTSR